MALSCVPPLTSKFQKSCDAAWLRSPGAEPMTRHVSLESVLGDAPGHPPFVAEKTPPFVEGEVHVLARCRFQGCDRGALAWRQAFYSVDLVDGALRVFRSDEDRRTWRRQGGENLAKWAAVIGGDHIGFAFAGDFHRFSQRRDIT